MILSVNFALGTDERDFEVTANDWSYEGQEVYLDPFVKTSCGPTDLDDDVITLETFIREYAAAHPGMSLGSAERHINDRMWDACCDEVTERYNSRHD